MNRITFVSLIVGVAMAALVVTGCKRQEDPKLAMVLSKLDSIDKRLANIEKRPAAAAAAPAQRPRPDPNTVYYLPVDASDAVMGAPHGKVTIVEAFEFACPHCMTTSTLMEQVLAKYPDVQVVHKQYIIHPQVATLPALAACAANKQGKYAAFERELWKRAWPGEGEQNRRLDQGKLSAAALEQQATDLGLDVTRFKSDMNGESCKAELGQKMQALSAVGVNGTPALFINGKPWQGARSIEAIGPAIEQELKKADQALAGGTKLEDYYASLIKTGKKTL